MTIENPFASPPPVDNTGVEASSASWSVRHVTIVGILMIVHGVLILMMAGFLGVMAAMMPAAMQMQGNTGTDAEVAAQMKTTMTAVTIGYAVFAVVLGIIAILNIVAGVFLLGLRSRVLAICALAAGLGSVMSCYCAPTSIGLAIYGLIVLLNQDVARAFELRRQGQSVEKVKKAFGAAQPLGVDISRLELRVLTMPENEFSDPLVAHTASLHGDSPLAKPRATSGMTAIAVIAMIMGGMGMLGAATTAVSLVTQGRTAFVPVTTTGGGSAQSVLQTQAEMQAAMGSLMQRFFYSKLVAVGFQLPLCIALIYGGIRFIRLRPGAARFLLLVFLLTMLFELARGVFDYLFMLESFSIQETFLPRIMVPAGTTGRAAEQAESIARITVKAMKIVGPIFFFGWIGIKLFFYGFGIRFLRSEPIRQKFETAAG